VIDSKYSAIFSLQILAKEAAAMRDSSGPPFSIKVRFKPGDLVSQNACIMSCNRVLPAAAQEPTLTACMQIGGTEVGPLIIWGAIAFFGFGAIQGLMAAGKAITGRQGRGKGKWVYDRSLGGKKVSTGAVDSRCQYSSTGYRGVCPSATDIHVVVSNRHQPGS
jgi:hypothetical protein